MNGYLVLLRHTMDDLPVGLYESEAEACFEAGRIAGGDGMPSDAMRDVVKFHNGMPVAIIGSMAFE